MGFAYTNYTHYLVAYDVCDSKRLSLLFKLLKRFGYRKQNSLFEAELTMSQYARLEQEIKDIVYTKEDSVMIYPMNKYNLYKKKTIGREKFRQKYIV